MSPDNQEDQPDDAHSIENHFFLRVVWVVLFLQKALLLDFAHLKVLIKDSGDDCVNC